MWVKVTDGGATVGALVQDADGGEWFLVTAEGVDLELGRDLWVSGDLGDRVDVTVSSFASRGLGFELVDGGARFSDEDIVKLREM